MPPAPGPAEGSFYAQLFRNSDTVDQGNLQARLDAPQATAGDLIRLSMMVFLPDEGVDTRAQILLDDGDFGTARAWVVPDGAGNVLAVGPGFAWQEWDLEYAVGASTFSVTVNGVTASGFTSDTTGAVDDADLFNGARSPAGVFYLDAVPAASTVAPEPGALGPAGLALLALAVRRFRR